MAAKAAYVGNLFLVRWDLPSATHCAEIRAAFGGGRGRDKPVHIGVIPADMPELSELQTRRFVELTQDMLATCAHVALVVEAGGARGAAIRRAIADVPLAIARHYRLSIVDSIERALVWAPRPVAEAAELMPAFARAGCELPEAAAMVA